ncbi:MAG: UDP-2,3-diacetamido-2,3-dideoxy-D-glucuronate 2-epimerase [Firmicutes bacterium]|nr:UDP-2,3-diacetamido-2,3-dideoxy-D-glucuronate 2-epimerase [Bacillota bacterium]
MKVVTVVGARPQFVKAAAVSRAIASESSGRLMEVLVHTGQHYDENMSGVFFDELGIPPPSHNLEIAGGSHGSMTGRMLEAVEKVLLAEKPDWLLIYGDTNSTLAGALAAAKLHIPVAHVEAGLRSFNMRMPEEVNRIISDRMSSLLFCPTSAAVFNLAAEGISNNVHNVGDVMYDVALFYRNKAREHSTALSRLGLAPKSFALATCHRAENTDNPKRLRGILLGLAQVAKRMPVVFPLHPRTRKLVADHGLGDLLSRLTIADPIPFLDMVTLEQAASLVLTDSGGVQKEAFFYGVPCITMRDETEWVETVDAGWNCLVGADADRIVQAAEDALTGRVARHVVMPYGDGRAAEKIVAHLLG